MKSSKKARRLHWIIRFVFTSRLNFYCFIKSLTSEPRSAKMTVDEWFYKLQIYSVCSHFSDGNENIQISRAANISWERFNSCVASEFLFSCWQPWLRICFDMLLFLLRTQMCVWTSSHCEGWCAGSTNLVYTVHTEKSSRLQNIGVLFHKFAIHLLQIERNSWL